MSDTPHPQLAELEQRIGWFLANPQFDQCVVVEPDSQSIVRLRIPLRTMRGFRDEKYGRVLEVELTPDEAAREDVMLAMGFESLTQRKATWDGERNRVFPQFSKSTTSAREAARDVVRVMQDVFLLGDAWLWTFPVDDPDQWPVPLPKPVPWPPA